MRNPLAALCILLVLVAAALSDRAGAGEDWLMLDAPEPGSRATGALLEVRGHAGPRGLAGHDLVIAIDLSDSTLRPSGVDLDGDGPAGRSDPALLARLASEADVRPGLIERLSESDFEDSVLAAELAAAEALIARLEPRHFRIGLVVFSDEAWLAAPVGSSPERLRFVLERIRRSFHRDLRGTNLAAAVDRAHHFLRRARKPGLGRREQSLLLLSDGTPTLPVHAGRASQEALSSAEQAAADGIRVYSFALGRDFATGLEVFRGMAQLGGGRLERIERPADSIARLRRVDLADLEELRVENLTTGHSARALRIFPDGSFDGFVLLAPGENRLRIRARASDGRRLEVERKVLRDRVDVAARGPEQERLRGMVTELRRRTHELELWAEVERGRRAPRRELELEAEAAGSNGGG